MRSAVGAAGGWPAFRREFALPVPVLTYHHVGPPRPGTNRAMTVAPARFARQLRWLAQHGYSTVPPTDWLAWRDEGRPLPERPLVLTFDDAYADTATYALPLLEQYGFTATVYVVTGQIGGVNRWDTVGGWAAVPHPLMTAEQIRHWHGRGIDFGAHTRTHPDLRALDPAALDAEVRGSAEDLTALLGGPPRSFAYPYGAYDARVSDAVRAAFPLGLTSDEGLNYLGTDPAQLRRVMVLPGDSLLEFALKVRLGWSPLEHLRRVTGYRRGRAALGRALARIHPPPQPAA